MMNAATLDLRGVRVLPQILKLLAPGTEPAGIDPRVLDLRERLETVGNWVGVRSAPSRRRRAARPTAIRSRSRRWTRGGRG